MYEITLVVLFIALTLAAILLLKSILTILTLLARLAMEHEASIQRPPDIKQVDTDSIEKQDN